MTVTAGHLNDISGGYMRHGFFHGRPSYKHAARDELFLLFDGTDWVFSPTEQGTSEILGKFAGEGRNDPRYATAHSLRSLRQCQVYNPATDSFRPERVTITPQITAASEPPQRRISAHELSLRKALYGEPEYHKRRTGHVGGSSYWYRGRAEPYVVQERPAYQQTAKPGAEAGAAAGAFKQGHHARHTSNEKLRPQQEYTGTHSATFSLYRTEYTVVIIIIL